MTDIATLPSPTAVPAGTTPRCPSCRTRAGRTCSSSNGSPSSPNECSTPPSPTPPSGSTRSSPATATPQGAGCPAGRCWPAGCTAPSTPSTGPSKNSPPPASCPSNDAPTTDATSPTATTYAPTTPTPQPTPLPAARQTGVAAALRPNPDVPTETPPPPTTPTRTPPAATCPAAGRTEEEDLDTGTGRTSRTGDGPLDGCRTPDLAALADTVQGLRRDLGQPSVRWSAPCLATAIDFATKVRGWPAQHARHALLLVAADPHTRSPMRLAEAGPWWDHAQQPGLTRTRQEQAELDGLEATLADADDRAHLQATARTQLTTEGEPVTRLTVARRAARLLKQQTSAAGSLVQPRPSRGLAPESRSSQHGQGRAASAAGLDA